MVSLEPRGTKVVLIAAGSCRSEQKRIIKIAIAKTNEDNADI